MNRRLAIVASLLIALSWSSACSSKPSASEEGSDASAPHSSSSFFGKKEVTLPAGTVMSLIRGGDVFQRVETGRMPIV